MLKGGSLLGPIYHWRWRYCFPRNVGTQRRMPEDLNSHEEFSYYRSAKIDTWPEIQSRGVRCVSRGMPPGKPTNLSAAAVGVWTENPILAVRICSRNSNHRTTIYRFQVATSATALQPVTTPVTLTKEQLV